MTDLQGSQGRTTHRTLLGGVLSVAGWLLVAGAGCLACYKGLLGPVLMHELWSDRATAWMFPAAAAAFLAGAAALWLGSRRWSSTPSAGDPSS